MTQAHIQQATSLPRIAAGVAVAYIIPLAVLSIFIVGLGSRGGFNLPAFAAFWVMGAIWGSAFVLPACAAWGILHTLALAEWWTALLTGMATGFVLGVTVLPLPPATVALGGVTGLAVWAAAYVRLPRFARAVSAS